MVAASAVESWPSHGCARLSRPIARRNALIAPYCGLYSQPQIEATETSGSTAGV